MKITKQQLEQIIKEELANVSAGTPEKAAALPLGHYRRKAAALAAKADEILQKLGMCGGMRSKSYGFNFDATFRHIATLHAALGDLLKAVEDTPGPS